LITAHYPLSARETQCLGLAFRGLTARESADQIDCAERAVNFHLTNAMEKMQADNKTAAAQRASWYGLF
jgi:LuxR family transcriptional regulator, quorum-sensing system regulator SolR